MVSIPQTNPKTSETHPPKKTCFPKLQRFNAAYIHAVVKKTAGSVGHDRVILQAASKLQGVIKQGPYLDVPGKWMDQW